MEPELREVLKASFKNLAMRKGMAVLHGGLGAKLSLERHLALPEGELKRMEDDLEARVDRAADEMVDELEARHIETEDDVRDRIEEVIQVSEAYTNQVIKSV